MPDFRSFSALLLCVALVIPQSAAAQFGGIFGDVMRGATKDTSSSSSSTSSSSSSSASSSSSSSAGGTKCKKDKNQRGRNILGSVAGGVAGRTVGRSGIGYYVPVAKFSDTLSEAIACRLDPQEQEKAAGASDKAIAQAERSGSSGVGKTVAWESETRANVHGSSTVENKQKMADGTKCMTVTDVAIVDGEETRVQKKMCRAPGQPRYVLQA